MPISLVFAGPPAKQIRTPVEIYLKMDDMSLRKIVVSAGVVQLRKIPFRLSFPAGGGLLNIRHVIRPENVRAIYLINQFQKQVHMTLLRREVLAQDIIAS